jgi:hypothetical protein
VGKMWYQSIGLALTLNVDIPFLDLKGMSLFNVKKQFQRLMTKKFGL